MYKFILIFIFIVFTFKSIAQVQTNVEEVNVDDFLKDNPTDDIQVNQISETPINSSSTNEKADQRPSQQEQAKSTNNFQNSNINNSSSVVPNKSTIIARPKGRSANFFLGKTKIKDPFSLRDPFKSPLQKGQKKQNIKKGIIKNGIFTNLSSVEGVTLDQIKIVGILVGKERRAMARIGANPNPVILKEGMILGEDGAELKAILPGGIVLVEKIVNVYGEEEYLETVIPISEEQ